MTQWEEANAWEKEWWSSCKNTWQEEAKQIEYFRRMGFTIESRNGQYPVVDFKGKSCLDVGGGPTSFLLKCINVKNPTVVDPLDIPQWCKDRYKTAGITFINKMAEEYTTNEVFDEAIAYNLFLHVKNPAKIISNMLSYSKIVRIFDWLNTPISPGHIQTLKENELNEWLGGKGMTGYEMWGEHKQQYYFGIFAGNKL